MKTIKEIELISRSSVILLIATDWFIGGWLKCRLMHSRNLYI